MRQVEPVRIHIYKNSYQFTPDPFPSDICFLVFLSGENQVRINDSTFKTDKSLLFIAPLSMELSLIGSGKAAALICRETILQDLFKTSMGVRIKSVYSGTGSVNQYKCFSLSGSSLSGVDSLLPRIATELEFRKVDTDQIIQLYLLELFYFLKRGDRLSDNDLQKWSSVQRVWTINDIIHFIRKNFDGNYTLDDLASRCALNSSYFSRAFKETAGVPLFEFINRLRIERACQLLKSSDMTILDIAYSVGYNNISFFNRYFKKLHFISPGEYRRRIKG